MAGFWDNNGEDVSEYSLIEESIEESLNTESVPVYGVEEIEKEELDEIIEESSFDLSQQQAATIYNARLRLEQANLYEMLINHDLFSGVESSPQAIKNVQDELKAFIVTRLELLLGIRKPKAVREQLSASSDFNEVELGFLKALAYKGTKGASTQESTTEPKEIHVAKPIIKNSINPLGSKKPSQPVLKAAANNHPPKTTTTKPTAPQQKTVTNVVEKRKAPKETAVVKESTKNLSLQEIAQKDLEEMKKRKPFHKMNAKEKAEEIANVNKKHAKPPRPATAAPIPDENQLRMKYLTEQQSTSGNSVKGFNQTIAAAIVASKNNF